MSSVLRRLQRRLSSALQAPNLGATGRIKIKLEQFELAVLRTKMPSLEVLIDNQRAPGGTLKTVLIARDVEQLRGACEFPFHALASMEAKLFKPVRVNEARAVCFYSPPMLFVHQSKTVSGVEESMLTVEAQICMLNHAGVLWTAKPPPTVEAVSNAT